MHGHDSGTVLLLWLSVERKFCRSIVKEHMGILHMCTVFMYNCKM
ncbi:hypothetical protein OTSANNIE_1640 [Anaplasma phagocytophilum str. Annie]|nr:hypothetical protein OTSANNIE_1640 [Anaplasma phagocytophilum str. Annie]